MEIGILLLSFIFSIVIGTIAGAKKNRSAFGWFLLSCIISPLIAGLFLALVGEKK